MRIITLKKIIAACSILFLAGFVFAVDGGGSLSAGFEFDNTELSGLSVSNFKLSTKTTGWLKVPINKSSSFSLEANWALADYIYPDFSDYSYVSNTIDIPLVKYSTLLPLADGTLSLNVGRFNFSDATGKIFAQTNDGVFALYRKGLYELSVYGGYSGLQNAKNVSIFADNAVYDNKTAVYALAPGYVTGLLNFSLPNIKAGQTFGVQVLGFGGVQDSETASNRFYGSVFANGPIIKRLFYTFSFAYGAYSSKAENAGGVLTDVSLAYYPDFLSSSVSLNICYASDGFRPFTFVGATIDSGTDYSDLMKVGIAGTIKPISQLLCSAGLDFFVSDCMQWQLASKYQLFSDVSFSAKIGQVIPFAEDRAPYFMGTISSQISF